MITTDNFKFEAFNKEKHQNIIMELIGNSKSSYVKQVEERINNSQEGKIFDNAFLVSCGEITIGYLFISSKPKNYIFLEYLLIKDARNKKYGRNMLQEIEDYLFQNYTDLQEIRLDIDNSNIASQTIAENIGYYSDPDDLIYQTNPTSMIYKKFNPYYRKTPKK